MDRYCSTGANSIYQIREVTISLASFTQQGGYQSPATGSTRDTGCCQFAGMPQRSPSICVGQQVSPMDWQLFWLQIQKQECK
jgi:hypothetical protein